MTELNLALNSLTGTLTNIAANTDSKGDLILTATVSITVAGIPPESITVANPGDQVIAVPFAVTGTVEGISASPSLEWSTSTSGAPSSGYEAIPAADVTFTAGSPLGSAKFSAQVTLNNAVTGENIYVKDATSGIYGSSGAFNVTQSTTPPPPPPSSGKAADGTASATTNGGTTMEITGLTTKNANDVILLGAMVNSFNDSVITGITSSSGLVLVPAAPGRTANGDTECWWVMAPNPLTNETLTVAFSEYINYAVAGVLAVSGCSNPSLPFDTNPSLPAGSDSGPAMFSTTSADAMAVAVTRLRSTASPTAGAGATAVVAEGYFLMEYQLYTKQQTDVGLGATTGAGDEDGQIVVALA